MKKEIVFDEIPDVVDISTDKYDYVAMITNKEGIVIIETTRLKNNDKEWMTLEEGEYVDKIIRIKGDTFEYGKIDYSVGNYLRVKISKPIRNWTF